MYIFDFFWAICTFQIRINISFKLVFEVGGFFFLFDYIAIIRHFEFKERRPIQCRIHGYDMSSLDWMESGNQ